MITEMLEKISDMSASFQQVTEDIVLLRFKIVNAIMIGSVKNENSDWVLIDTALRSSADEIIECAEKFFGKDKAPKCIILTHGHFDHVGSVVELANHWNVSIYAHELELPYLTGKSDYPKGDPSVDKGIVAKMSEFFPNKSINLDGKIKELPKDGTVPNLSEWRYINTPGHTPGHISLFRERDRVLIVGDAFTTVRQESLFSVLTQNKEVNGPPAYFTTDWDASKASVKKLAELRPAIIIPSHGDPMNGEEIGPYLKGLVENFDKKAIPEEGRFVK
ncbi:MBL fold metallo-hydrolase [Clostridium sp. YIM B02505]|uniref:MBL fold metallo-hydrolase n=1 Tax=Clostridium yunnanense TaxID=2800325 RepID=A0ABS1ELJ7_9CLOT|nr:MBL fold metallo-hydrolase [Clostridium yunnanense]MBK1810209.1 MBL fold metallo-hydrolase [Clostridium yunnanense]